MNYHLEALSGLLARDPEAGQLHTRHLQILACLCASPEGCTTSAVAEALDISSSQLSRLLARLEERGLIDRSDPRFRPMLFRPTQAGRDLDRRVRGHIDACRLTGATQAA